MFANFISHEIEVQINEMLGMCILKRGNFFLYLNVILSLLVNLFFALFLNKNKNHNFIRINRVNSGPCVVSQAIFAMVLVTDCMHQVLQNTHFKQNITKTAKRWRNVNILRGKCKKTNKFCILVFTKSIPMVASACM